MVIKVFRKKSVRMCWLKFLFMCGLVFSVSSAEATTSASLNTPQNKISNSESLKSSHQKIASDIDLKVREQSETIEELKAELKVFKEKKSEGMSFEVWAGILLACAALLLTILGIGIAMLSIFGYRKIIKNSNETAQRIAVKVANETSASTINQATTTALIKLLEDGAFDGVIRDAVETISYRGMMPLDELNEDKN